MAAAPKSIEQQALEGSKAGLLVNSDSFKQAVAEAETRCTSEWRGATTVEAREAAYAKLNALELVVQMLRAIESAGQLAEHAIKRKGTTRY